MYIYIYIIPRYGVERGQSLTPGVPAAWTSSDRGVKTDALADVGRGYVVADGWRRTTLASVAVA